MKWGSRLKGYRQRCWRLRETKKQTTKSDFGDIWRNGWLGYDAVTYFCVVIPHKHVFAFSVSLSFLSAGEGPRPLESHGCLESLHFLPLSHYLACCFSLEGWHFLEACVGSQWAQSSVSQLLVCYRSAGCKVWSCCSDKQKLLSWLHWSSWISQWTGCSWV